MAVQDKKKEQKHSVTIRFCGDSGDGMQLTGTQFTTTSALIGNDISTFPDFPAEIRAPQGTLAGVSGFQVHFSSSDIHTPGDQLDVLVAMNPAAFKTNYTDLKQNGLLIVNEDAFTPVNLAKAGYLEDEDPFEVIQNKVTISKVPLTKLTMTALEETTLNSKEKERCKNFLALGLMYWMYNRPLEPTIKWLEQKFAKKPEILKANTMALKAGHNYGSTTELFQTNYEIPQAQIKPGTYRNITGNTALAIGLITASKLAERDLFYGSYPITPASDILHELAKYKNFKVRTFQAEDEIAAIGATVGAAFAGKIAVTGTSGPGICLKSEIMGLAVMTELPLVIVDIQRGGPSTGLPTKSEQSDLLQVLYGRNGDSPMPVIATSRASDCFDCAIEAVRIATKFMTPVVLLSDGYLANGSEPWKLPDLSTLPSLKIDSPEIGENFMPYKRDENLSRPWAVPGTAGAEHRVGGLEKENTTGKVNLSSEAHGEMSKIRAQKVANIANSIDPVDLFGPSEGDVLFLGWGSTYGSIRSATEQLLEQGHKVAHAHLRWVNPLPHDLEKILKSYKKVIMPEINSGQLAMIVRSKYLIDIKSLPKLDAKPFAVSDLMEEALKEIK